MMTEPTAKTLTVPRLKRGVDLSIRGVSGLRRFAGFLREEFLKDLQGQEGARRKREMRDNDAIIGAMFQGISSFFLQTEFPLTPALAGDAESEACAQFGRECLDDMEHPFQTLLTEFLTCMEQGHSEHAIQFKMRGGDNKDRSRRSRYSDGKIGWRKIALRSQASIFKWNFDEDDTDRAVSFVQQVEQAPYFREVELSRCVQFLINPTLGNPEGRSLLRNSHKAYTFLCGLQEIEAIMHQRIGLGVPVLPVPASLLAPSSPDAAYADTLLDALSQFSFGERAAMLVPSTEENGIKTGYGELKFMRPDGALADIDKTIQRWEGRMAMTLLMDFLMVGANGDGSRALHTDKTEMFRKSLYWLADLFCNTFTTQALYPLFRINGFRQDKWAKLGHGAVVPVSFGEFCDGVNKLVGAAVLTPGDDLETSALKHLDLKPRDQKEDAPG